MAWTKIHHGDARVSPRASPAHAPCSPKRARANTTMSTAPTSSRCCTSIPATSCRRDARRLRGQDHARPTIAYQDSQLPVPQSTERADLRQRRREGRCARGLYQVDRAARAATGRHHRHLIPEFGGLVGTGDTALLERAAAREREARSRSRRRVSNWNDKITLPYEPFIGTHRHVARDRGDHLAGAGLLRRQHGPARRRRRAPSSTCRSIAKGACSISATATRTQGDGELCGVAVEHPTVTTVQVDLIKGWTIAWPRLENETFIMTIGCARPMEDAARIAYRELIRWMVEDYGFDEFDAYMLLTQAAGPARQHGRPQVHAWRLHHEIVPGLNGMEQPARVRKVATASSSRCSGRRDPGRRPRCG